MAENVNVPAVGKVDRKWVLAGGAAVAGIVVFAYWRNSRVPPEDPATEGDQYAAGDDYTPDAYIGATQPGGETYDPNAGETNLPQTNAEWSQRVVEALVSMAGYTPELAAQTVGKYLAGQPLTVTERILIQTAIALLGNPPAGAIPIINAPATPTTPTTPATAKLGTPHLVRATRKSSKSTQYHIVWTKVPRATFYELRRELGPGSPTSMTTPLTSRVTPGLKHHYTYQYRVRARGPGGPSPWSAPIRFKVP